MVATQQEIKSSSDNEAKEMLISFLLYEWILKLHYLHKNDFK